MRLTERILESPLRAPLVLCLVSAIACGGDGTSPSLARIEISPDPVTAYEQQSLTLEAAVYDARGARVPDTVTWSSASPAVIQVDSLGHAFATGRGSTTITARTRRLARTVDVAISRDSVAPIVDQLVITPAVIDLSAGDATLSINFRARDAASGIKLVYTKGEPPDGPAQLRRYSDPCSRSTGSANDGVWHCRTRFHRFSRPGTWRVVAYAEDYGLMTFDSASTSLVVQNSRPDGVPPRLTGLTFTDERTTLNGAEHRILIVSGADAESGVLDVEFFLADGVRQGLYGCGGVPEQQWDSLGVWHPAPSVTARCPVPLVASSVPVIRALSARVRDARGNVREYTTDDLRRAGFITEIDIAR